MEIYGLKEMRILKSSKYTNVEIIITFVMVQSILIEFSKNGLNISCYL